MQPSYNIRVASLHMQDTGTYNPVHERPIVTDVRDMSYIYDLTQRLEYNQTKHITPQLTSGIASHIVAPSAIAGQEIRLLNGWDTRRIRFILRIIIENGFGGGLSDDEYYLQGFTDHAGVLPGGIMDPNMLLIINSFVRVGKENVYVGESIYQRRVIKDSAQIINGDILYQSTGHENYGLRPIDAFMGLQSIDIYSAQQDNFSFHDKRFQVNNKAMYNNKYHTAPSAYLASLADSYCSAYTTPPIGNNPRDIYEQAKNNVGLDRSFENLFFKRMKSIRGFGNGTVFTVSDLEMLDPNIQNNVFYARMGASTHSSYHHQGDTEYWTSALLEAQWSTILGQAVPALLMELMISNMVFLCTNKVTQGQGLVTIISANSITGADVTAYIEVFKDRLIREVLMDISQNNAIIYDMSISADVFGEITIDIALDSNPSVRFCIPTFLDSVITPMITTNSNIFYNTINDVGTVLSNVVESIGHDYGSVNPQFNYPI